jgi:hypothetical protein
MACSRSWRNGGKGGVPADAAALSGCFDTRPSAAAQHEAGNGATVDASL